MSPLLQRRPERRAVLREQRGGLAIALVLAAECAVQLWIATMGAGLPLLAGHATCGLLLALVLAVDHLVAARRVDDARVLRSCRDVARLVVGLVVLRAVVAVVVVQLHPEWSSTAVLFAVLADSALPLAASAAAVGGLGHAARVAAGVAPPWPGPRGRRAV